MLLDKLLSNLAVHVEPFAVCEVCCGWRVYLPGPREVMLHYALKGAAVVRGLDGIERKLDPNWLAIVPKGVKHTLASAGAVDHEITIEAPPEGSPVCRIVAGSCEPEVVVACGAVRVRYGQALDLFNHLKDVLTIDLSGNPQVRAQFEGIMAEQAELGPGSGAMTSALMTQCLVQVFRHLESESSNPLPWLPVISDPRLSRAIDLILDRPGDDHTVESLAETATMSRSAFAERFTAAFGQSPMNLVHHVRMQHAALLLGQRSDVSVDDVSGQVGFSSRSHFSQAFKKHCGVSPAEYRRLNSAPPHPPTASKTTR
jgi:AraC-like DNA-binding protein